MYPKDESQRILAYEVMSVSLTVGTPSLLIIVRPWEGAWSYVALAVVAVAMSFIWAWWFWYNLHYVPAKYPDSNEQEAIMRGLAVYDTALAKLRNDVDDLKKGLSPKRPSFWRRLRRDG